MCSRDDVGKAIPTRKTRNVAGQKVSQRQVVVDLLSDSKEEVWYVYVVVYLYHA